MTRSPTPFRNFLDMDFFLRSFLLAVTGWTELVGDTDASLVVDGKSECGEATGSRLLWQHCRLTVIFQPFQRSGSGVEDAAPLVRCERNSSLSSLLRTPWLTGPRKNSSGVMTRYLTRKRALPNTEHLLSAVSSFRCLLQARQAHRITESKTTASEDISKVSLLTISTISSCSIVSNASLCKTSSAWRSTIRKHLKTSSLRSLSLSWHSLLSRGGWISEHKRWLSTVSTLNAFTFLEIWSRQRDASWGRWYSRHGCSRRRVASIEEKDTWPV